MCVCWGGVLKQQNVNGCQIYMHRGLKYKTDTHNIQDHVGQQRLLDKVVWNLKWTIKLTNWCCPIQNITQLLGCVPREHVPHMHNSPLVLGVPIYGEHSCYELWTFQQATIIYHKFLTTTSFFVKKPSCSCLVLLHCLQDKGGNIW